ncbi:FAD:protein FMN transferase [uncultured Trichococcus sp.]|uniref:FAD:protein FMN transferase n=1 Tax=uncultured Trichococcus sp. TaxID=189665 RepID=UPI002A188624|nr:FAD:protein FMN transferase [uncultured Trichococcus sp.]
MNEAKRTIYLMGTVIQLWIQHPDPEIILENAENRLRDYEKRFSANDKNSDLMKINTQAGKAPVTVDKDLFELIKLGKMHSLPDDSALNITIGPLIQLWRIGFEDAQRPSEQEIKQKLKLVQPESIILDEENNTVYLEKPGMAIDLGALAKGYFADKILEYFVSEGVRAALIDLGGNVVTYGEAPQREDGYWRIGIQHPMQPRGKFVLALKSKNQSIVTSGIYERTFTMDGKTYHHIFDSRTGYPLETDIASITVVSDKSVDGEIWTTRLFAQKPEQVIASLNSLEGFSGIVITKDGTLLYSKSLSSQIVM